MKSVIIVQFFIFIFYITIFSFLKDAYLMNCHHMILQWLVFSEFFLANRTLKLWINATCIIQMMFEIVFAVCTFIRSAATIWTKHWIIFKSLIHVINWKIEHTNFNIVNKIKLLYKYVNDLNLVFNVLPLNISKMIIQFL